MTISKLFHIGALSCFLSLSVGCGPQCEPIDDYLELLAKGGKLTAHNAPTAPNGFDAITNDSEAISASEYLIEIRLVEKSEGSSMSLENTSPGFTFSLFENAYACSYPPPLEFDTIHRINITSDANFSPDYPAGTSLNPLFKVEFYQKGVLDGLELYGLDVTNLSVGNVAIPELLQLALTEEPSLSKQHQFTVTINSHDLRLNKVNFIAGE